MVIECDETHDAPSNNLATLFAIRSSSSDASLFKTTARRCCSANKHSCRIFLTVGAVLFTRERSRIRGCRWRQAESVLSVRAPGDSLCGR